jgi:hypothetical protein
MRTVLDEPSVPLIGPAWQRSSSRRGSFRTARRPRGGCQPRGARWPLVNLVMRGWILGNWGSARK